MINYILIAIYLALSVGGLTLFKLGTNKEFVISVTNGIFNFKISLISILGLLCYLCSFLMYMFLISQFDMTYIVPVTTGIVQIMTFIVAISIFGEALTVYNVTGTALILIGVLINNFKK